MLEEGVQILINQDASQPDSEEYGEALIMTALERFERHPEIAEEVKAIFASYVKGNDPLRRYTLWSLLQYHLVESLVHCSNATSFQATWIVRNEIIEEQQKAITEAVSEFFPILDSFFSQIKGIELSGTQFLYEFKSIEPNDEIRSTIDTLLFEIDTEPTGMSVAAEAIDRLRGKTVEIADYLDKKLSPNIPQLRQRLETEAKKDGDVNYQVALSPSKQTGAAGGWEPGIYQRIADEVRQASIANEDDSVVYWLGFQSHGAALDTSTQAQLVEIHAEAKRLQHIRYNLWAMTEFHNYVHIDNLAIIDRNWLFPPVAAMYDEKEAGILNPVNISTRSEVIRTLLTTPKVGFEAF